MENLNINNQTYTANLNAVRIPRMLPVKEVVYFTGLGTTTIYDMLDKKSKRYDPTFPTQVKLSKGRVAWVETEIAEWLECRMAARIH